MHVAFDVGEVLCEIDWTEFINEYEAARQYREGQGKKIIGNARQFLQIVQRKQDLDLINEDEMLLEWGFPNGDIDGIVRAWNHAATPNKRMLEAKKSLQESGVKVAILSNMGRTHYNYLQGICPEMFEGAIRHISCEVGARKPSKLFFQSFLMENPDFKNALFVDDKNDNLEIGKKFGLRPFSFVLSETKLYDEKMWGLTLHDIASNVKLTNSLKSVFWGATKTML